MPETHCKSLLPLCYSPVFSEQLDLDKNCTLTQGQVEGEMGNVACKYALVFRLWVWTAIRHYKTLAYMLSKKQQSKACLGNPDTNAYSQARSNYYPLSNLD